VVALFNAISEANKEAAAKASTDTDAKKEEENEHTQTSSSRSLKEGLKAKLVQASSSSAMTGQEVTQNRLNRITQPKGSKLQKTESSATTTAGVVSAKKWAVFQDSDPALDHKLSLKVCNIYLYLYVLVYVVFIITFIVSFSYAFCRIGIKMIRIMNEYFFIYAFMM